MATFSWALLVLAAGCASGTTGEPRRAELRAGSTSDLVKYAYFTNHVELPISWDQGMPAVVREFDPRSDHYAYFILAVYPPRRGDRRDFVVRGIIARPDGSRDAEFRQTVRQTPWLSEGGWYWKVHILDAPSKPFPGTWTVDVAVEDRAVGRYTFVVRPGPPAKAPLPSDAAGLIGVLKDATPERRAAAADKLWRNWSASEGFKAATPMQAALPALVAASMDQSSFAAAFASDALVEMARTVPEALTAVAGLLQSADDNARSKGVDLVTRIGPAAEVTKPRLAEMLRHDRNGFVRRLAIGAIDRLGLTQAELPAMIAALGDEDSSVRQGAATILKPNAAAVLRVLARELDDDRAEVRWNATRALHGFGTVARVDVAHSLSRALGDADARVRGAAARGLAELAAVDPLAIQMIRAGLADGNARTRAAAVDAIGAMAPRGSDEITTLTRVLKDPDVTVRLNVVRVIGDIGRSASSAARSFRTSGVAEVVASYERTAKTAEAALRVLAEDPSADVRAEAGGALRDIGRP